MIVEESAIPAEAPAEEMSLEEYIRAMKNRTSAQIQQARARLISASPQPRSLPPGKTLEDVIVGQLPDEENDADIWAALEELS